MKTGFEWLKEYFGSDKVFYLKTFQTDILVLIK